MEDKMKKAVFRELVVLFLCVLLMLAAFGCTSEKEGKHGKMKGDISAVLEKPKYIGSDKCKECHWREHDSWKHTLHSKFIQLADSYTVLGDFEKNNKLSVKVTKKAKKYAGKNITNTMLIKNGKYYVNTIGPDNEFHDYEVISVIGINKKQNYLTEFPNGQIHVLPVEWDADENTWSDKWGLKKYYPGSGKYWSNAGMAWQFRCAGCHVTGLQVNYDSASNSFDTEWVDLGIGCEACHGPGNNHVKAAKVFFDREKDTIVNPAKLPWRLRAMVCGQCHNWGLSAQNISPVKEGFPDRYAYPIGYRPGKPLDHYYTDRPDDEMKHHQQYNEWRKSVHSTAGIMCTTCHGVHQEGAHKSPNKSQTLRPGDTLCTGCHKMIQKRSAHKIHTFGSCVGCHMPPTTREENSHAFKFISPEESIRAGGTDKKQNSCSHCHHHEKTPLKNLVEFLDSAKKADMPKPFDAHVR